VTEHTGQQQQYTSNLAQHVVWLNKLDKQQISSDRMNPARHHQYSHLEQASAASTAYKSLLKASNFNGQEQYSSAIQ
jgi:uncharacterized lipoprotein